MLIHTHTHSEYIIWSSSLINFSQRSSLPPPFHSFNIVLLPSLKIIFSFNVLFVYIRANTYIWWPSCITFLYVIYIIFTNYTWDEFETCIQLFEKMISFNTIYIVFLFGSFLYFIYEQHLIFSDRVNGKKLFNYIMNFSSIN